MNDTKSTNADGTKAGWTPPRIAWEEAYEPLVFAASCTSQPFNCGTGARD